MKFKTDLSCPVVHETDEEAAACMACIADEKRCENCEQWDHVAVYVPENLDGPPTEFNTWRVCQDCYDEFKRLEYVPYPEDSDLMERT